MEKDYNSGFESHPMSKDVGFHGNNKVIVEFNEMQLKLLDSLMPWFGTTHEEVLKNILLRWAEQNIATKEMQALKAIGGIS